MASYLHYKSRSTVGFMKNNRLENLNEDSPHRIQSMLGHLPVWLLYPCEQEEILNEAKRTKQKKARSQNAEYKAADQKNQKKKKRKRKHMPPARPVLTSPLDELYAQALSMMPGKK